MQNSAVLKICKKFSAKKKATGENLYLGTNMKRSSLTVRMKADTYLINIKSLRFSVATNTQLLWISRRWKSNNKMDVAAMHNGTSSGSCPFVLFCICILYFMFIVCWFVLVFRVLLSKPVNITFLVKNTDRLADRLEMKFAACDW